MVSNLVIKPDQNIVRIVIERVELGIPMSGMPGVWRWLLTDILIQGSTGGDFVAAPQTGSRSYIQTRLKSGRHRL